MQRTSNGGARLGRRAGVLLAVAGGVMALAVVAAVVVALSPALSGRVLHALSGAAGVKPAGAVAPPSGAGYYYLRNFDANAPEGKGQYCLTVTTERLAGDKDDGKFQVRAWGCNFVTNQKWYVYKETNSVDAWRLRDKSDLAKTEDCLDVENASLAAGATVTTFTCRTTSDFQNQLWYFMPISVTLSSGTKINGYEVYGNQSDKCLTWVHAPTSSDQYPYTTQDDCAKDATLKWIFDKR